MLKLQKPALLFRHGLRVPPLYHVGGTADLIYLAENKPAWTTFKSFASQS